MCVSAPPRPSTDTAVQRRSPVPASPGVARGVRCLVVRLDRRWRAELRPYNVRVMQVNPSEVITEFGRRARATAAPTNPERKLTPREIAHVVHAMLAMDDVGFITDAAVWAANPWS